MSTKVRQQLKKRQSIISIERGRFIPSIETALRLSFVLNIPIEKLFWLKEINR